jgi:hypothetical protein
MGHTSPQLALAVYAQAMRRDEHVNEQLRTLVDGSPMRAQEEQELMRAAP